MKGHPPSSEFATWMYEKSIYNALLVSTEYFQIDLPLQLMLKQNEILKGILKLSGRFIENPPDGDDEKAKAYDR